MGRAVCSMCSKPLIAGSIVLSQDGALSHLPCRNQTVLLLALENRGHASRGAGSETATRLSSTSASGKHRRLTSHQGD